MTTMASLFYHHEHVRKTCTPNYKIVEKVLKKALTDTADVDAAVATFMSRLPKLQTSITMKKGSRKIAVVYRHADDGTVYFAYSRFINKTGKEHVVNKKLRTTAFRRFHKSPCMLYADKKESRWAIHKKIINEIAAIHKREEF